MYDKILRPIDWILNYITMYRLVLYYLIVLLVYAAALSLFNLLPFTAISLILSTLFILAVSWITNTIFSKVFEAPTNLESIYISALILALIVNPAQNIHDYVFLFWASVFTMSSKYILAINKKHIFNPVAISVVITSIFLGQSASWWVGNSYLMPVVLIGGLLIVKKIQREDMVFMFVCVVLSVVALSTFASNTDLFEIWKKTLLHSSLFFFSLVMLTEPLTSPTKTYLQMLYAGITGVLFVPQVHIGSIYTTPEIALVVGNLFAYLVSSKDKLVLHLSERIKIAQDTYDFLFKIPHKLSFSPGQYMEWTIPHDNPDSRGNRRYFTLASSPTEETLRIGVKFNNPSSSFKRKMLAMDQNTPVVATYLAGHFTLPRNKDKKLVFMAGGIGITPFRSMVKYLMDKGERRDIYLFYSNKEISEISYKELFDEASANIGLKVIYALTNEQDIPSNWDGLKGRITADTISKYITNPSEYTFYLSGPRSMVNAYEDALLGLGVHEHNIKTDFFPGFV